MPDFALRSGICFNLSLFLEF